MEFSDVINKRYSVRGYLDKEVEREKLEYVLKAATIAPTGVNYKPFKVFVIDTKKNKEALSKIYSAPWFVEAPYVICVVSKKDEAWVRKWDNKNISEEQKFCIELFYPAFIQCVKSICLRIT